MQNAGSGGGFDARGLIGQQTWEKEAQIRLDPYDPGRQEQTDPDDPRSQRSWFRRFWTQLRAVFGRKA